MAPGLDLAGSHRARVNDEQTKDVMIIRLKRPNRSAKYPGTTRPTMDAAFRMDERLYASEGGVQAAGLSIGR